MKKLLNDFIKNEDGVTAIEYAVIGVAMAAGLALAVGTKGSGENGAGGNGLVGAIIDSFNAISKAMKGQVSV
ncbi:Flp family type IVb pilin [Vibrio tubiashii]|uniref:Flp family type IVb pilin n=1 Tax=Vibrio tubiashii TaxID=29498 RepID=UPI001EFD0DD3|nr:Flp family type IVb pilin [Vibrio tubiashii]MCG9581441.1 Flp family type IVb pilin [Vibrio tubiashii]MCG9615032.1 Flp family type IVb pilin [Vibrio tubiashii]MCG9687927.1 Flp family type IVb pilin [Vibrio tubiashii]